MNLFAHIKFRPCSTKRVKNTVLYCLHSEVREEIGKVWRPHEQPTRLHPVPLNLFIGDWENKFMENRGDGFAAELEKNTIPFNSFWPHFSIYQVGGDALTTLIFFKLLYSCCSSHQANIELFIKKRAKVQMSIWSSQIQEQNEEKEVWYTVPIHVAFADFAEACCLFLLSTAELSGSE